MWLKEERVGLLWFQQGNIYKVKQKDLEYANVISGVASYTQLMVSVVT